MALNCTTQKKLEFFFQTQPLNDKPITLGKFLLWNQQIDDGGKNIKMQFYLCNSHKIGTNYSQIIKLTKFVEKTDYNLNYKFFCVLIKFAEFIKIQLKSHSTTHKQF